MDGFRRVVNNTIISLVGQCVTWASTLFLTIAYGRFLGAAKFGELYFAITFVFLIGTPVDAGYGNQIVRDVAQEPAQALAYFWNVLIVKLVVWLALFLLALLLALLFGYSPEVRMLVGICGVILLSTAMTNTFASIHYAFERTMFPAIGVALEKGLTALIGILLLKLGYGVEVMALVMLVGSVANMCWQGAWFFRLVGRRFIFDAALIRRIVRTNIPFLIYGVLMISYYRIDTVLLSFMANSDVIGWYGAGTRIIETLNFLPNIVIMTIMYPIFARLSTNADDELKVAIEKSTNFLLFCGIPICMLLIVTASNIIGFLYARTEFDHTIPTLWAFAPGLVFSYMSFVASAVLLGKKQDKKIPLIAAVALVFNLALNLILIPLYQHVGAAIVTALTEMLVCVCSVYCLPRHLLPLRSLRVAAKALLASLVMAAAILPLHFLNIFAILPIAVAVYLLVSTLLGTIPREDYLSLYSAIRKRGQTRVETQAETVQ